MGWRAPKLTEWHWKAVVERRRELPREEARRMYTRAARAAFRDRRVYIPGGVAVAMTATGLILLLRHPAIVSPSEIIAANVAFAVSLAVGLRFCWMHDRVTQSHVAAEFPTLCPTCGYDCNATPACCPECGTESPAPPVPRR